MSSGWYNKVWLVITSEGGMESRGLGAASPLMVPRGAVTIARRAISGVTLRHM